VYQELGCHGNKVGQMLFGQDMMQIDSPKPSSPEPGSPEPGSPESKCMTMNLQSDASFFGDLDSKEFVFGEVYIFAKSPRLQTGGPTDFVRLKTLRVPVDGPSNGGGLARIQSSFWSQTCVR
jgi:hypothetical protein